MKSRRLTILLSFILVLSQFILAQQPASAAANPAPLADAEQDALPIIWSLPITLTQTVDQLIDGCVRIAFDVSQWSQNFTGTLTYSANSSPSYRPTPRDRLRMIAVDGTKVDFWIANFQGTTSGGADEFLGSDYQLVCHAQHATRGDLTATVDQASTGLLERTRSVEVIGSLIHEGREYEVDAQALPWNSINYSHYIVVN